VSKLKAIHIMCKRDTESVKVVPESVLSNRGNLEGTHLTRFSPEGGLSPGLIYWGVSSYTIHGQLAERQLPDWNVLKRLMMKIKSN